MNDTKLATLTRFFQGEVISPEDQEIINRSIVNFSSTVSASLSMVVLTQIRGLSRILDSLDIVEEKLYDMLPTVKSAQDLAVMMKLLNEAADKRIRHIIEITGLVRSGILKGPQSLMGMQNGVRGASLTVTNSLNKDGRERVRSLIEDLKSRMPEVEVIDVENS